MDMTGILPGLRIEEAGRFHSSETSQPTDFATFANAGATLHAHVAHVVARARLAAADPARLPQSPFALGLVDRGWSFTQLIGNTASQLDCTGVKGCMLVDEKDRHPKAPASMGPVAIVGGGTRLRELVDWAHEKPRTLTVATSGTHLGPTIASAIATSSHGSRLRYGGIQNMIRGLHLITGPSDHVWIESSSAPVLTDVAAARLEATQNAPLRILRDDDQFDDALVHLGGMGIVNCVAIELVRDDVFKLVVRDKQVDLNWLGQLSDGKFDEVAKWLGENETAAFYETTIDPHAWDGAHALHTFYMRSTTLVFEGRPAEIFRPADAIGTLSQSLSIADLLDGSRRGQPGALASPAGIDVPMRLFDPTSSALSVFDYYRALPHPPPNYYRWSELHRDEITGGTPGALYNASFAIPRDRLTCAIPAICDAVKHLPRLFVFTIRFVSEPRGGLAFTRFDDNAVIEIDGLSKLACQLATIRQSKLPNPDPNDLRLLKTLEDIVHEGAKAVRQALDDTGVPYSMHWAKLGDLDRAKVLADFGDPVTDPCSSILRWRRTRDTFLGKAGAALFWNEALVTYGVLERPT